MNLRRVGIVFGREFGFQTRRVLFWVWAIAMVLLAWGLSGGAVRVQSGDVSPGGTKAFITSEFAVTQVLVIFTCLIHAFFTSVIAGTTVIRDEEEGIGALLHSTSLRPGEYVAGKFAAVLAAALLVLAIQTAAMIVFNHAVPAGEAAEFRGPLVLSNYVRPALLFCAPTIFFFAATSFALGEWSRKPVVVFLFPVVVFLGSIFFLWDFAPSWLSPAVDRGLMVADPAGFRWLQRTQLEVDRGAAYYNTARVPIDATLAANRALVLLVGLFAAVMSGRHFASRLRGVSRRAERQWREQGASAIDPRSAGAPPAESGKPLAGALGTTTRRPGLFAGAWHIFRGELVEIRSSPGLYLFVPLLIFQAVGPLLISVGAFDTPMLITPGTFAIRTFNALTTMLCLMLMFYSVESLWRDRQTRLAAISLATPIRTGSILLGKAAANAAIGAGVMTLMLIVGLVWLAVQRVVPISIGPILLVWGALLLPTVVLWTSFIALVLALTRNRYATYAIAFAVLIFTGWRQVTGSIDWRGNWPMWSAVRWSDISVLEFDRSAIVLNRLVALGFAVFFVALTTRIFPRRELDATAAAARFRPGRLARTALGLLPLALPGFIALGALWVAIERGSQGDPARKLAKDYWRKNFTTYRDFPVPDVAAVDFDVELDPDRSSLRVVGSYELVNNLEKPIDRIPMTPGLHYRDLAWKLDDREAKPDIRAGLHVLALERPLARGERVKLGFSFRGEVPQGSSRSGGGAPEFILPSGVVLQSFTSSFGPRVGYLEEVGIDEENRYETKEYPDDFHVGQTDALFGQRRPFRTKVKITGPADWRLNSVGKLVEDVVDGDRRRSTWVSDHPVHFFNIVAGRWVERKGQGVAVHHDERHPYNIDLMLEGLEAARKYYSEWFHPYPWEELKLSEFPGLATYAQGFPTNITFSESIGFLTKDDPESSAALTITAHESAHQWWGNLISPGKGPSGNLISEGTAHFSTQLLLEKIRGPKARRFFARKIETDYAEDRVPDSERPLMKIDGSRPGDNVVTYDKTGFVLWMLMKEMGRDRMLAGIREFFEKYRDNPDHPVLADFLDSLRPHAPDASAFDTFVRQWFREVVVPEFQLEEATKTRDGDAWMIRATLKNVGTGRVKVMVAAERGVEPDDPPRPGAPAPAPSKNEALRRASTTIEIGAGESKPVEIRAEFEPERLVVDPELDVLMLRRKAAISTF